jgi:hypothetical protein
MLGCFGAHGAPYGRFTQAMATLFAQTHSTLSQRNCGLEIIAALLR